MAPPSARAAPRLAALLLLSCALLATPAGAESDGSARLSASAGFDTNARRDFLQTGADPDLVASALLALRGQLATDGFTAQGRYDLGLRKFLRITSEDALVQAAGVDAVALLGHGVRLGLTGQAKDRRGERSYTDLLGGPFLELVPDNKLEARVEARAHRFIYWPSFGYSFSVPELSASVRYRFNRQHSMLAFAELGPRRYNSQAREDPRLDPPPLVPPPRQDTAFTAGASYAYKGPFTLTLGYGYLSQASNSFGESFQRHRFSLSGAARLPWRLILMGDLAFQTTRYPDGVYLSPSFTLQQDDESYNQLSLRLVRPLTERLDVELSYAVFQTQLPLNGLTYLRMVGGVGVAFRL